MRYPIFDKYDIVVVPLSLFWCGFALFWELSAIFDGAPLVFAVWGIPFILLGLYLVVGRLVVRAIQLRNTTYVITSYRLIETVRRPFPRTTQAYLRDLAPPIVESSQYDGAVGSVAFGSFPGLVDSLADLGLNGRRRSRMSRPLILRHVAHPRLVSQTIATALSKSVT